MILYLDTSSLIKLYVEEGGSQEVRRLVEQASVVSTSVVAYPEARAALARIRREKRLSPADFATAKADLEGDWGRFYAIQATPALCQEAGDLAERHGLRGFDAIHLASYVALHRSRPGEPIHFSTFDDLLNAAASKESP